MAKYKPCNEQQMIMLPISLQDQLVPGTLEHTIREVVDKHLDLSVFDGRYRNDETGAAAIHPNFYAPTKRRVDVQWRLYAMVHNLGKIQAFGRLK